MAAANKSKAKGSAFELKIAKLLTQHYKIEFKRVPMSGALAFFKGDIFSPKQFTTFEYVIECKHYKAVNFNSLLTAKSNDMYSWWEQTQRETKQMNDYYDTNKDPLLIFRWDRSKDFVVWNNDINIKNQMTIQSFDNEFKIGLLSEWLNESQKPVK